jgi:hypothetical protein
MNRRNVLSLLGSLPVVGPKLAPQLAQKLADDNKAALLGGVRASGLGPPPTPLEGQGHYTQRQLALQLPWVRDELRSLFYERHHTISYLDPDLAVLKSVSLSAKICYQRQRNVEREINEFVTVPIWHRMSTLLDKIRSLLPL